MKWRKKVLLAKVETTYGTDASPTGANNAMLAANVEITPLQAEQVQRETVQDYLGSRAAFHVGKHVALEFDVEMAGSGAAGTAPAYGALLRACGWSETVTAIVDTQYDPVSENEDSATIHFHMDGSKHALVGCRGTVELRLAAKAIPVYHFSLLGMYVAPTAATDPTPTLTSFQTPLTVGNVNTPTFSLHSYSGKLQELTLTQGNEVVHRELVGSESIQITDRAMTGSITIEAPPLGTKDYFAAASAGTQAALQVVHGTSAGNIVQLDAPNVQLLSPRYAESDGVVMLEMDLNLVPGSSGDDELKITVK